ncbi:MAG: hypothetical protein GX444_06805 [Myxococcales bacterium]|nr:hypothetical protein [Myxococcales bacterium]
MKTSSMIVLWLFLICCGLTLAGCGDDDDATGDDAADDDAVDDDDDDDDDAADDDTTGAPAFTAVDLESESSPAVRLAIQACAGLYNRQHGGSVYTILKEPDARWLDELAWEPSESVGAADFLAACVADFPCLRYSYAAQQELLPNILTVGAVLGAIPLDEGMQVACATPVFDAVVELAERNTPYLATKYIYENYVAQTTGWAMINPGYDENDPRVWDPALTGDLDASLVDYVFSARLFVTFLINGCIKSTPENELLEEIAGKNPWPSLIGVYGYASYWKVFGGFLFESQTRCVESRNLGQIATAGVNNLSFFSSRREPIREANEIEQNAPEEVAYDPEKTYVAFVVGDGDNIAFIMDARSQWIRQRLAACDQPDDSCAPITWTISPHLSYLAPDVLEWYYDQSHQTGKDYFMLPPSGHLYAYPASLNDEMQDEFVAATERDALLLGAESTVDWEWWNTWRRAETEFLPKYAREGGVIRGLFPVNVPYMFPTFTWAEPDRFFKVLVGRDGGEVVLFRPREWRGIDDSGAGLTKPFYLSPEKMAQELGDYPRGTVAYVYLTSDGGLDLENSFLTLVKILPAHVRLVSADTAARLALEASRSGAVAN